MSVYTFLFSDIQGSTRLWEAFPSIMDRVISRHDELVHGAVRECGGEVYKHTGDGMAAIFSTPSAAVEAALQAQQTLFSEEWGDIGPLKVRMGVHTGEAQGRDGDFFGSCLNREMWTRVVMGLMPEQVFAGVKALIRDTITDEWAELVRRIPELAS